MHTELIWEKNKRILFNLNNFSKRIVRDTEERWKGVNLTLLGLGVKLG